MRVSNFLTYNYGFQQHQNNIAKYQKEIEQDGISFEGTNSVSNTLAKLNRDDNVTMLDQQINSLKSIENNMNKYDINFQAMRVEVDKFKELMLNKNNNGLNSEGIININVELSSIIETIETLEKDKLNENEDLFGFESELITSNSQRTTRSFDSTMIEINGTKISDILKDLKDTNDISGIKSISDKLDMNLTIVGSITSQAESQRNLKELFKAYEEKYLDGLGNIEESIIKMNNAIKAYETSMLMYGKIQDLSLVNYL